jgi:alpha-D-ribose 1-methylphosphonate 5-triphosphate synthase subunit PhnH
MSSVAVFKEPGFDEVFDSQRCFRLLLEAMSRPGTVCRLPSLEYAHTPSGLNPYVLTVLKTLCDNRVRISALVDAQPDGEATEYLRVNTMTPAAGVEEADYVVFEGSHYSAQFEAVSAGSFEFPETSATALLQVQRIGTPENGLGGRETISLLARGPGIADSNELCFAGLAPEYIETRNSKCEEYPVGLDVFLLDNEGSLAAYPRSTRLVARTL